MIKLEVGKVYLLAGGLVFRYHGLYDGKGPCLSFRSVQVPLGELGGPSFSSDEVPIQEVTKEDLPWLRGRWGQARGRGLRGEEQDMAFLIKELGGVTC